MKTKIKLLFLACSLSYYGFSQLAISVANGNWTNPTTWSCVCVPIPGATVVINHTVTLNTNFGYTSGSITINSAGALLDDITGRDLWINGGGFSNNGNVDLRYLLTTAGNFSNAGTLTARAYSNTVNFTNTGIFQNLDSMVNNGILTNNGSFLNIDSIVNAGTFINNGKSIYNQFTNTGVYTNTNNLTFTDITNTGTITNSDSIIGLNSMWNQGRITNNQNALIKLNRSLWNKKLPGGTAAIINNGTLKILDSYYNYDTIRGITGKITVQDSSVNYGRMLQSFDFCDYTPVPAPNIDYNYGTISPGVTYCLFNSLNELSSENIILFPNPVSTQLIIDLQNIEDYEIIIRSVDGREIIKSSETKIFNTSQFPTGLYFVTIKYDSVLFTKKIQVIN